VAPHLLLLVAGIGVLWDSAGGSRGTLQAGTLSRAVSCLLSGLLLGSWWWGHDAAAYQRRPCDVTIQIALADVLNESGRCVCVSVVEMGFKLLAPAGCIRAEDAAATATWAPLLLRDTCHMLDIFCSWLAVASVSQLQDT